MSGEGGGGGGFRGGGGGAGFRKYQRLVSQGLFQVVYENYRAVSSKNPTRLAALEILADFGQLVAFIVRPSLPWGFDESGTGFDGRAVLNLQLQNPVIGAGYETYRSTFGYVTLIVLVSVALTVTSGLTSNVDSGGRQALCSSLYSLACTLVWLLLYTLYVSVLGIYVTAVDCITTSMTGGIWVAYAERFPEMSCYESPHVWLMVGAYFMLVFCIIAAATLTLVHFEPKGPVETDALAVYSNVIELQMFMAKTVIALVAILASRYPLIYGTVMFLLMFNMVHTLIVYQPYYNGLVGRIKAGLYGTLLYSTLCLEFALFLEDNSNPLPAYLLFAGSPFMFGGCYWLLGHYERRHIEDVLICDPGDRDKEHPLTAEVPGLLMVAKLMHVVRGMHSAGQVTDQQLRNAVQNCDQVIIVEGVGMGVEEDDQAESAAKFPNSAALCVAAAHFQPDDNTGDEEQQTKRAALFMDRSAGLCFATRYSRLASKFAYYMWSKEAGKKDSSKMSSNNSRLVKKPAFATHLVGSETTVTPSVAMSQFGLVLVNWLGHEQQIDSEQIFVRWKDKTTKTKPLRIKSIEETPNGEALPGGRVVLEDGSCFENPEGDDQANDEYEKNVKAAIEHHTQALNLIRLQWSSLLFEQPSINETLEQIVLIKKSQSMADKAYRLSESFGMSDLRLSRMYRSFCQTVAAQPKQEALYRKRIDEEIVRRNKERERKCREAIIAEAQAVEVAKLKEASDKASKLAQAEGSIDAAAADEPDAAAVDKSGDAAATTDTSGDATATTDTSGDATATTDTSGDAAAVDENGNAAAVDPSVDPADESDAVSESSSTMDESPPASGGCCCFKKRRRKIREETDFEDDQNNLDDPDKDSAAQPLEVQDLSTPADSSGHYVGHKPDPFADTPSRDLTGGARAVDPFAADDRVDRKVDPFANDSQQSSFGPAGDKKAVDPFADDTAGDGPQQPPKKKSSCCGCFSSKKKSQQVAAFDNDKGEPVDAFGDSKPVGNDKAKPVDAFGDSKPAVDPFAAAPTTSETSSTSQNSVRSDIELDGGAQRKVDPFGEEQGAPVDPFGRDEGQQREVDPFADDSLPDQPKPKTSGGGCSMGVYLLCFLLVVAGVVIFFVPEFRENSDIADDMVAIICGALVTIGICGCVAGVLTPTKPGKEGSSDSGFDAFEGERLDESALFGTPSNALSSSQPVLDVFGSPSPPASMQQNSQNAFWTPADSDTPLAQSGSAVFASTGNASGTAFGFGDEQDDAFSLSNRSPGKLPPLSGSSAPPGPFTPDGGSFTSTGSLGNRGAFGGEGVSQNLFGGASQDPFGGSSGNSFVEKSSSNNAFASSRDDGPSAFGGSMDAFGSSPSNANGMYDATAPPSAFGSSAFADPNAADPFFDDAPGVDPFAESAPLSGKNPIEDDPIEEEQEAPRAEKVRGKKRRTCCHLLCPGEDASEEEEMPDPSLLQKQRETDASYARRQLEWDTWRKEEAARKKSYKEPEAVSITPIVTSMQIVPEDAEKKKDEFYENLVAPVGQKVESILIPAFEEAMRAAASKVGADPEHSQGAQDIMDVWSGWRRSVPQKMACVVSNSFLPDCPLVYCSDGFEILTGFPRMETLGVNCRFLQGEETMDSDIDLIRDATSTRKALDVYLLNYKKNRQPFFNFLHLEPALDRYFVGVQIDVTSLTEAILNQPELSITWWNKTILNNIARLQNKAAFSPALTVDFFKDFNLRPALVKLETLSVKCSFAAVNEALKGVYAEMDKSLAKALKSKISAFKVSAHENASMTLSDNRLPDCPLVYASSAFYELTGFSPEDVIGKNCRFLQGPESNIRQVARLRSIVETKTSGCVFLRNYTKSGDEFWSCICLAAIKHENGPGCFFGGCQVCVSHIAQMILSNGILKENEWEALMISACTAVDMNSKLGQLCTAKVVSTDDQAEDDDMEGDLVQGVGIDSQNSDSEDEEGAQARSNDRKTVLKRAVRQKKVTSVVWDHPLVHRSRTLLVHNFVLLAGCVAAFIIFWSLLMSRQETYANMAQRVDISGLVTTLVIDAMTNARLLTQSSDDLHALHWDDRILSANVYGSKVIPFRMASHLETIRIFDSTLYKQLSTTGLVQPAYKKQKEMYTDPLYSVKFWVDTSQNPHYETKSVGLKEFMGMFLQSMIRFYRIEEYHRGEVLKSSDFKFIEDNGLMLVDALNTLQLLNVNGTRELAAEVYSLDWTGGSFCRILVLFTILHLFISLHSISQAQSKFFSTLLRVPKGYMADIVKLKPRAFLPADQQALLAAEDRQTTFQEGQSWSAESRRAELESEALLEQRMKHFKRSQQSDGDSVARTLQAYFTVTLNTKQVDYIHRPAICGCIRGSRSAMLALMMLFLAVGVTSFIPYNAPSLAAIDELHNSHKRMTNLFLTTYFAQELVSVNGTAKAVWQNRISQTLANGAYQIPNSAYQMAEGMTSLLRAEECGSVNCTFSEVNRTMPFGSLQQSVYQSLHMAAVLAAEKREPALTPSNPKFLELWRMNRGHIIPNLNLTIVRYNTDLETSTDWVDSLFVLLILASVFCVLGLYIHMRAFTEKCGPQSAEVLVALLSMLPNDMQDFEYVLTGRNRKSATSDE